AVLFAGAAPLAAQSTEFGVLFGGSSRSVDEGVAEGPELDDNFSFSRSSIDFYYGIELDPGTMFKIRAGRIDTPISIPTIEGARVDFDGQVQHLDAVAEYRFSEPFGTAGLFAGVGLYRQVAGGDNLIPDSIDGSEVDYGFLAGVNTDFPLSRRYGVVLEATHYWTRLPFNPRFLTVSGGLRIRF
ncbi:MAG TPA: hypothetical protein VFT12_10885, partial [Thermoanaerobaculia bacterium]|nr:hypothetical protein [Thermoanaerobaculia bacterium]